MDQAKTDDEIERSKTKTVNLPHKNSKLLVIKNLIIIKIIKMILTIKVIVIIPLITIITKRRGRYRAPTTTNSGAPCDIT